MIKEREQASKNLRRAGRTTADVEIDGDDLGNTADDRVAAGEAPAIQGAVTDRDDPFRIGRRVIGSFQRLAHVLGHRTGHQKHVGVAWRRDKADAESLEIVIGVVERMDLELAPVAGPRIDLTYR
jgi:hypothetical protein